MLARRKCHKIVQAGKIVALVADSKSDVRVEDVGGTEIIFRVPPSTFARSYPSVGDYLVVYEDGYVSKEQTHDLPAMLWSNAPHHPAARLVL